MVSVATLGSRFIADCQPAAVRSVRQFVEEEVILPEDGGPHAGEPFSCEYQPAFGLFFDELDTGCWPRVVGTAPTQVGKTACLFVVVTLHALLERRENVVCGLPDMRMAQDKWTQDILPIIEASPNLASELPHRGEGSKGGRVKSEVRFRCGSTLRFMSAGTKDTGRAGFTARCLAVTEADAMGRTSDGSVSVEANPVEQLQGRLRATRLHERSIFLEGTVGVERGLVWQELQHSSNARILLRCPHCREWVSPEREHLVGWQAAESQWEAFDRARWICPACAEPWTEDERHEANHRAVLCHHGQTVTKRGRVQGPLPKVFTFGFRMSAVNNLFLQASDLGAELWKDRQTLREEDFERKTNQMVFATPYVPPDVDLAPLEAAQLVERVTGPKRGIAPKGTYVTVGIDTSKRRLDWVAVASTPDSTGRVIEYGEHPVDWRTLGTEGGLLSAFRGLVPLLNWSTEAGETIRPAAVWIDAHYHEHTEAVFAFCRAMAETDNSPRGAERFRPCWGEGHSTHMAGRYRHPSKTDRSVRVIGREYYLKWVPDARLFVVHVNADHWKTEVRDRMARPLEESGALSVYTAPPAEHQPYFEELTAEKPVEKWSPEKGTYIVWERIRRRNHKLDATYLALGAAHFVAAQLARQRQQAQRADWWSTRKKRGRP